MPISRRGLVGSLALVPLVAEGQETASLKCVADAHGVSLSEERLRVLKPVIEMRKTQLKALRDFQIADSVDLGRGRL